MNNSWWQELMHFFLQGMTLKQLIHMLIILIILIIVMPVSIKEWINLHNPEDPSSLLDVLHPVVLR
ncbi:hypothetical protein JNE25001_47320 (plasmid) [Escherichia coli]